MRSWKMTLVLPAALLLLAPFASAQWSDNFDAYSPGSLTGQGGWGTWDDDPTCDAFVVNTLSHSSPNCVQVQTTTDAVHLFSETSGQWVITAWQFIPSGSTGLTYFILLNSYQSGGPYDWSLDLEFDCDLGLMSVVEGSGAAFIVENQWVEIKVEFDLDGCTQSIYYNGAFVETIPWQTTGVNEFRALDLFADTGSAVYYDDISLQLNTGLAPATWGQIKTLL
jgi:hypothetical protein